jgi:hypothetical protein
LAPRAPPLRPAESEARCAVDTRRAPSSRGAPSGVAVLKMLAGDRRDGEVGGVVVASENPEKWLTNVLRCNTMHPMSLEPRDHQLTIRIPLRIREAIEADATTEGRTVADVVNNVLAARYPISESRPPMKLVRNPNAVPKFGGERVKLVKPPK